MGAIQDILDVTAPKDRRNTKTSEVCKISISKRIISKGVDIEIVQGPDLEPLPDNKNALVVYVRALIDDKRVAFGSKGDIEIERFRIVNPPILVYDESKGRYVEDPESALISVLSDVIKRTGRLDVLPVDGRRGSTVTVIYSEETTGTGEATDGHVFRAGVDQTFAAIIAANGTGHRTDHRGFLRIDASTTTDQFERLGRTIHGFDTSAIGTDTINSAVFTFDITNTVTGLDASTFALVEATPAVVDDVENADFENAFAASPTSFGESASLTANGTKTITLNSSGRAHIDGSGDTMFGMMLEWDRSNTFGGTWASGQNSGAEVIMVHNGGSADDPYLTVTHEAAGGVTLQNRRAFRGIGQGVGRGI